MYLFIYEAVVRRLADVQVGGVVVGSDQPIGYVWHIRLTTSYDNAKPVEDNAP